MITINKTTHRQEFEHHAGFYINTTFPEINLNNSDDVSLAQLGRIDCFNIQSGFVINMHSHKNDEMLSSIQRGIMMHRGIHRDILEAGLHI